MKPLSVNLRRKWLFFYILIYNHTKYILEQLSEISYLIKGAYYEVMDSTDNRGL